MTDKKADFLRRHETMIDFPRSRLWQPMKRLQRGLKRTAAYWQAIEQGFDKQMNRLRAQAEQVQPTPAIFAPPPAPQPRRPSTASIVSAPVSRQPPGSEPRPVSPERMATTLSIAEQEVARNAGISLQEYARQKLKMQAQVRSGKRQA
jgi:hypothetical protein